VSTKAGRSFVALIAAYSMVFGVVLSAGSLWAGWAFFPSAVVESSIGLAFGGVCIWLGLVLLKRQRGTREE